jgi:glycosyltransferase involved in cell wall biosynthesis
MPSQVPAMISRNKAKSIKLLFITTSFPTQTNPTGGVFVERLARTLAGHAKVEVLIPGRPWTANHINNSRLNICKAPYAPKRFERLFHHPGGLPVAIDRQPLASLPLLMISVLSLAAACSLKAVRCDAVISNWSLAGAIGGLIAGLLKRPSLCIFRGDDINREGWAASLLVKAAARFNQHRVVVSADMADRLSGYGFSSVHIPNGVDDCFFLDRFRPPFSPLKVLTAGSLIPRKRLIDLVQAVAKCSAKDISHVTVMGTGPLEKDLKRMTRELNLEGKFHFIGAVKPDEAHRLYHEHDVFVLCSDREGRANVLVEAMAAGCAVIATDIPGTRELIEDGREGLLYPVGDVEALKQHLLRCTSKPEHVLIVGRAASRKIRSLGLTWQACARRYLELLFPGKKNVWN